MSDLISRQSAIDAMNEVYCHIEMIKKRPVNKTEQAIYLDMIGAVKSVPSAEPERNYCRECKWSKCFINCDKHGNTETYWHCLNWDGGTDEEGFCYEWERRADG